MLILPVCSWQDSLPFCRALFLLLVISLSVQKLFSFLYSPLPFFEVVFWTLILEPFPDLLCLYLCLEVVLLWQWLSFRTLIKGFVSFGINFWAV